MKSYDCDYDIGHFSVTICDICYHYHITLYHISVTNFIQLVSSQLVDQFSQTKLPCKAPNKSYLHIYGMYKSDNKQLRYQVISNCKIFIC